MIMESKADLNQLNQVSDTGERTLAEYVNEFLPTSTGIQPSMARMVHAWLLNYLTDFVEVVKLPEDRHPLGLQELYYPLCPRVPIQVCALVPDAGTLAQRFAVSQAFSRCAMVALCCKISAS